MKKLEKTKKLVLCSLILFTGFLASCASNPRLYNWYDYDTASYWYSREPTDINRKHLIQQYEKIIYGQKNGHAYRQTIPPGICADYGYFLYLDGRYEEAQIMLDREVELYPESKDFVLRLTEMLKEEASK